MVKRAAWFVVGWMIACGFACSCSSKPTHGNSGTGGSGTGSGAIADYCTASCTEAHSCDNSVSEQLCTNTCKNNFAALAPKLRSDFLSHAIECIKGEDCTSLASGNAHDKCTNEAVAVLSPSATGTSFCTAYENAASMCSSEFDKTACYEFAKTYNDASLTEAEACFEGACADLDACVSAALGDVSAIVVTGPGAGGPGPGSGGASGTGGSGHGGSGHGGSGGSSNGSAGDPGSAGSGTTGGPLSGPCTSGDPTECVDATSVNACSNGVYEVTNCATLAATFGFDGNTCTDTKCDLGEPTDATCETGASVYCTCDGTCSADGSDWLNLYVSCFTDDPAGNQTVIQCLADYVTGTQVDCNGALTCLPPP